MIVDLLTNFFGNLFGPLGNLFETNHLESMSRLTTLALRFLTVA
jgi:hypothetical protein